MIEILMQILEEVYPKLKKIDEPGLFLSVIFTMIDQYAADYDIEPEDIMRMTQKACEAQKLTFEKLGVMDKSIPE